MLNFLIIIATNLLRTCIIYKFMNLFYIKKKHFAKEYFFYGIYFLATATLYIFFHNIFINIIANIIGLFLLTNLYDHRFIKSLFVSLSIYIINMACDGIVFILLTDFRVGKSVNEIYAVFTVLLIYIVYLIVSRIIDKKKDSNDSILSFLSWFSLLSIPVLSTIIIVLIVIFLLDDDSQIALTFIVLGILIINIIVFHLYNFIFQIFLERMNNQLLMKQVEAYSTQLKIIKESQERYDSLIHDMKHHLRILYGLSSQNTTENSIELNSYIKTIENYYFSDNERVNSGNKDIDSILNYFYLQAKSKLIDIQIKVTIPADIQYNLFDINILLGNLLDNAIYAATNSIEKVLLVKIHVDRGVLHIQIVNSYSGNILFQNNMFMSTKRNGKQPGLGLKNVNEILKKNNGSIKTSYADNRFEVNVILYLNQMKIR